MRRTYTPNGLGAMSADGWGSEDGALAENGSYIYLCGECK